MRRDNKGRPLQKGEYQYKSGRYKYSYTHPITKKRKSLYSWRLLKSDRTPAGKTKTKSLRELEEDLQKDFVFGVKDKTSVSLRHYVQAYLELAVVKPNTEKTFEGRVKALSKTGFLDQPIQGLTTIQCKTFLKSIEGAFDTKNLYKTVLGKACSLAIDDQVLISNPFSFSLRSIVKKPDQERLILSVEEEKKVLDYAKEHKKRVYPLIYFMFKTGLRVSEVAGLKIEDIFVSHDKSVRGVYVKKQLSRIVGEGLVEQPPKSKNGIRFVPINETTHECIKESIITWVNKESSDTHVFQTTRLTPHEQGTIYNHFKTIGEAVGIPNLHPHSARYTCCSRLAAKGMNPKALQKFMGHGSITITLDYYADLTDNEIVEEFKRVSTTDLPRKFPKSFIDKLKET